MKIKSEVLKIGIWHGMRYEVVNGRANNGVISGE